MSTAALAELLRRRDEPGGAAAARRLALLEVLARAPLPSAAAVRRLHECLCWLRAYADDAALLRRVEAMLARFARRADLRRFRRALADSGIAGTDIHYRFFAGQAQWLAQRWPQRLRLDRSDGAAAERIARALPTLLPRIEAAALAEARLPGHAAIDRLRGRAETDAVFLLRRIAALPGDGFTREAFSDAVDASYVLAAAATTPSRSAAFFAPAPRVLRHDAPRRGRPELRAEIGRAPKSVRRLGPGDGEALADLARAAMVTRARSLEAFSFAEPRDAWLVDDGGGLALGLVGVQPARRHPLAATYGALALRNGVPIGYMQSDIVGADAALSFNTFETFRGGEAAFVFARWLAALRHLFGCSRFGIEPYQLGDHNDEALDSGAWWFYAKLGFVPHDAATAALAQRERQRLQRGRGRRSSPATLRRLAARHLYFDLGDSPPLLLLAELGLRCGAALAARGGADREGAITIAAAELQRLCAPVSLRGWRAEERAAWRALAPLLTGLDLASWPAAERQALVPLVRAKAARSERDFVARYRAHPRLDAALRRWAAAGP